MATAIGSLDSRLGEAELGNRLDPLRMLDGLNAEAAGQASCALIRTANSSYLFLMTGPVEQRGLLVGGALGECPSRAVLVGAMPYDRGASDYPLCLRKGSRVIFVVELDGAWKRLITSQVIDVVHAVVESRHQQLACHEFDAGTKLVGFLRVSRE